MRGNSSKTAIPPVSPGGIQRFRTVDTSLVENGHSSPRQTTATRAGAGKPKVTAEETKVGKTNDTSVTRSRNAGESSQGGAKTPNGDQKRKGGTSPVIEEVLGPDMAQANLSQIKEMLTETLSKVEISLKADIAAVRADIGQVLGRVEEIEERMNKYDQKLVEKNCANGIPPKNE